MVMLSIFDNMEIQKSGVYVAMFFIDHLYPTLLYLSIFLKSKRYSYDGHFEFIESCFFGSPQPL